MVIILILLPLFVNAFYLLYTPKILVIIPFLLLSIYLSFKEKYVIESLSTLLFTFSILIILIYSSALTKYIDISRICPIFTIGSNKLMKASFLYASITSIPNILTIHYSKNNFQDDLKNYLYASLTNFIIVLFTILSLGEPLINIFSFPEYAVLKQIKILNFIENVENLSTFIWYFDMFITLSALTNNIKEVLPKKFNKIYFYLCILLVLFISIFVIGSNYQLILNTFYSYPWILFIFFIIFIILFIFLKNKPKNTP